MIIAQKPRLQPPARSKDSGFIGLDTAGLSHFRTENANFREK
jgi:hypothetical protein